MVDFETRSARAQDRAAAVSPLSLSESLALIDALSALDDVATAFLCQPRFQDRGRLNPAGEMLETILHLLTRKRDELVEQLDRLPAEHKFERIQQLATLLRFRSLEVDDPRDILALAARFTQPLN